MVLVWMVWSYFLHYWYIYSGALFALYYLFGFLRWMVSWVLPKKHNRRRYYDSEDQDPFQEYSFARPQGKHEMDNDFENYETNQDYDDSEEEEEGEYITFDDIPAKKLSFDDIMETATRWAIYVVFAFAIGLVLFLVGAIGLTFYDKWQEGAAVHKKSYEAHMECMRFNPTASENIASCDEHQRKADKSIMMYTAKHAVLELLKSVDECVWYLRYSPAAWLVLAVIIFLVTCKVMWPSDTVYSARGRGSQNSMYFRLMRQIGFHSDKKKRKSKKKRQRRKKVQMTKHEEPMYQQEYHPVEMNSRTLVARKPSQHALSSTRVSSMLCTTQAQQRI